MGHLTWRCTYFYTVGDFLHTSRLAVGPTQSPVQWVPGHSLGEAAWVWPWPPTPSSVEVKERIELYLYPASWPSWLVVGWYFYIVDNNTKYFVAEQKFKGNPLLHVHNNTAQLQLGKQQYKEIVLLRFRGNSAGSHSPHCNILRELPILL